MTPSDPWAEVRLHLETMAPPVHQRDVTSRKARSIRRPLRNRWAIAATCATVSALVAVALLSRDEGTSPVETAGRAAQQGEQGTSGEAGLPSIRLADGTQISSVQVVNGRVWIAAAKGGAGSLLVFDEATGDQVDEIPLPGEVPESGLERLGGHLVLPVIDELGTTGTGIYAVRLDADPASLTQIAPLDRAVTTGTDGTSLWVRGQDFGGRVASVTAGNVESLPVEGFGWIDGEGELAWTSDRDSGRVSLYEGRDLVSQAQLEGSPSSLMVSAVGVEVALGSTVVRLDRRSLETSGVIELSEPVLALDAVGNDTLALGDRSVTRILPNGSQRTVPFTLSGPASAIAVSNARDAAIVCAVEVECRWVGLS